MTEEANHYISEDFGNILVHKSIVDKEKYEKALQGGKTDCALGSMRLFLKLENTGVKRMRGKRFLEQRHGGYHYWVENDKYVFEEMGGLRQIFHRERYYNVADLKDVEQSQIDMFFEDEFEKDKVARKLRRDLEDRNPIALQYRHEIVNKMIEANA